MIIYVPKIICYMFTVIHKAMWKWRREMSKTQFTSSGLRDLLFVVRPMKLVNSKDEGLPGGFLLPSKLVQCSQTCSHRFSLFVPSLTYILNTSPLPRHKHQNSVVPAFSKTGSCSLKLVSQNPSLGNPQRLLPKSRNGIGEPRVFFVSVYHNVHKVPQCI